MTPEEELKLQREITAELRRQARFRDEYSSSIEKWNQGLEELKHKQQTIRDVDKEIVKLQNEIAKSGKAITKEDEIRLEILEKQREIIRKEAEDLQKVLKDVKRLNILAYDLGKTLTGKVLDGFKNIDKVVVNMYGKLKSSGLFEMDKAMKQTALQMGVLSKESIGYRTTVTEAAKQTIKIGVGLEELTAMQASYSESLGRNVMMSEEAFVAMSQMAKATGLGAEGAGEMAVAFENVGLSVEQTRNFVDDSLKSTHKLGLNASKTMKNLLNGMKLMNKYSFKDGIHGLERMAKVATKLGVSMEFAAGMSDKLFNIEGAVDMSAQLQVMGGEWAKLADPFHLMYMARNDLAGLTEELGKAAESSVHFRKESQTFEISAMEMQRLKIVADQAGISVEELATAGKNAAKFTKIKSQISFSLGTGKDNEELKEFITNKSTFDKDGKATIKIGTDSKALNKLTELDKSKLKQMMTENQNMQKRAEESRTFDEAFSNLIVNLKLYLLPIIDGLNKTIPGLDNLSTELNKPGGWGDTIKSFASTVGDFVAMAGKLIMDNPLAAVFTYFGTKILFNVAQWFLNGKALRAGFDMSGTPGVGASSAWQPGQVGPQAAGGGGLGGIVAKSMGVLALAANVVDLGMDAYKNSKDESLSTGEKWGKTLDENKGKIILGLLGAALAIPTGGLSIAAAAGLGATVGSGIDNQMGTMFDYGNGGGQPATQPGVGDAYVSPMKKATNSRAILNGGKITPIDNKDGFYAAKKGGPIDNALNSQSQNMTVDFGEIKISGQINVVSPGAPSVAVDLLKDTEFKRNIATAIAGEFQKNKNGGKLIG